MCFQMCSQETDEVKPADGHIFEISSETLVLPMHVGEVSNPTKKRGRPRVIQVFIYTGKRPECLPDDWVVDEQMRLSGPRVGRRYKYFVEPGTGKLFRSLKSMLRHLGLPPKSRKHKSGKSSLHDVVKFSEGERKQ